MNLITDDRVAIVDKLLLTKTHGWRNEREWRVIDYGSGFGIRTIEPRYLAQVIFGARMPAQKKSEVLALLEQRAETIDVLQAELDSSYGITLRALDPR